MRERYFAFRGIHQQRRDAKQRRLPRPIRAKQRDEFARRNLKRNISESYERTESLFDAIEADSE